jgi:hypothetical protein
MRTVRVGETVPLEAQFLDANGDARDLSVAGGAFRVLSPDGTEADLATSVVATYTITANWTPTAPGMHFIQPRITTPADYGSLTPFAVIANL